MIVRHLLLPVAFFLRLLVHLLEHVWLILFWRVPTHDHQPRFEAPRQSQPFIILIMHTRTTTHARTHARTWEIST